MSSLMKVLLGIMYGGLPNEVAAGIKRVIDNYYDIQRML